MSAYNAAVDMVDRNVSEGRGAKVAFADPARRISYAELAEDVARVGPMLARLGLQREDRFAMIMQDTVDFPVLFWGAIRAGIIPIPLNTLLPVEQFRYILQDSRAKALFVSPPHLEAAEAASAGLTTLKSLVVAGEGASRYPAFGKLLARVKRRCRSGDDIRRSRVLALFIGFDRHAEGRAPHPHQPDANGEALRPGCARHHR